MARRSYQQMCSVARALALVGERWTLLIVRNLSVGPRRYSELLDELPGVTTNLLAARLKEMVAHGLITPTPAQDESKGKTKGKTNGYALTSLGRQLIPVVHALGDFGEQLGPPNPADHKSAQAILSGLVRRYRPGVYQGRVELELERRRVTLQLGDVSLGIEEGGHGDAPLQLVGSLPVFGRLLLVGEPLRALPEGSYTLKGKRADLKRLQQAFRPAR